MGLLSALLFLGGVALIIGGIVAVIANRVGTTVGRDHEVRTVNAESNRLVGASLTAAILQNRYIEKLSDQISVMLVPSEGGGLILDLGSLTPTPSTPPSP